MTTIKIKGGLGNQMFQYAYGKNLSVQKNEPLIINIFDLKNPADVDSRRDFDLDKFNISAEIINKKPAAWTVLAQKIKSKITGEYGFFQSEKYFTNIESVIRREFTLKNPLSESAEKVAAEIKNCQNPVSIHIRRGDYVTNKITNSHHGTCGIKYYEKAIEYIKEKVQSPTLFVFSDEIAWVKENLKIEPAIFVSDKNVPNYEEMILMSKCSHHIIANSSFSWWGAWLNPNESKIVIAPKQWLTNKTADELDILPPKWIQI